MKTNTKQLLLKLSIHRKKVIVIENYVNIGTQQHHCANYANSGIMSATTEKGGHNMVNLNEGMSTKEVAEILGVSERTVRNICKSKELAHYKVGTKIVIIPEDLTKYIESLKIEKEEE